jgi:hypothetical protein
MESLLSLTVTASFDVDTVSNFQLCPESTGQFSKRLANIKQCGQWPAGETTWTFFNRLGISYMGNSKCHVNCSNSQPDSVSIA